MQSYFVFASHTPLKDFRKISRKLFEDVENAHTELRKQILAFDPELVISLGPDHFNGFFYKLMPAFCVGATASSVGDWNTPRGNIETSERIALDLVSFSHNRQIDVALSYDMQIDHGFTQLLNELFEWTYLPPLVPVFINCAAPPLPPMHRMVSFGNTLGEFLRSLNARVLVTASGGLSHDPPIPTLANANEKIRARLVNGGELNSEQRNTRQQLVLAEAEKQTQAKSNRTPLNPSWDKSFLNSLKDYDFNLICEASDSEITSAAGCGAHEVRTWVAAATAAQSMGVNNLDLLFYEAIPEWVAGYGIMLGKTD